MLATDRRRAVAACTRIVADLGLTVDDADVLHDSNKLTVRLLPCDAVARVAHEGREVARFEVDLARRLADEGAPVASLDPRVEPRVHVRDGFVVTLWTHYESVGPRPSTGAYADGLRDLHAAMRTIRVPSPHHADRVAEAALVVSGSDRSPALTDRDRALLRDRLRTLGRAVAGSGAPEQLLHGEPHPLNVIDTASGVRFVDLETCCRGPVEFDLAHAPRAVGERYPEVDDALLEDCRGLVLAMVAAWRWEPGDQLPDGRRKGRALLAALDDGPPWPALDVVMGVDGGTDA